jgi:kynurenine formamidase
MRILDLTRPLNAETAIYEAENYRDPPLVISSWCRVQDRGFAVARLEMGTQTGTHIDAPAHFLEGGATLEDLDVSALVGPYFLIQGRDLEDHARLLRCLATAHRERILLLLASPGPRVLGEESLQALLSLKIKTWCLLGSVQVAGQEPLYLHRILAQSGVYLVEDLDESQVNEIQPGGEILALPLRLEGVSGSPCRVLVRF